MEQTNGQVKEVETAEIARVVEPQNGTVPGFASKDAWELAQRQAKALMASSMVPENYRNNIGNCIIALDMAYRMGASPLMVMQNLYIVNGRPGWSAQFLIATFNKCGRFAALRYEFSADKTACYAWSVEKRSGERIEGAQISMAMAQAEGWSTKPGSKWKTMPHLMLQYRAAAFLIRTYAPEIAMGLHMAEEVEDIMNSGDELCSAGQVGMIESLLASAEIRQEEKERIEGELGIMSGSQAIRCITYLKAQQPADVPALMGEAAQRTKA